MAQEQGQEQTVERTLVLLKPDAVVRGFAGKIITRFEDATLKIVGIKMKQMDADFTRRHYFDLEERHGSEVYNMTATFMQQGPVIALVLEGFDAVATVRKIVGSTYPNEAPAGTVRGTSPTTAGAPVSCRARRSPILSMPQATRMRRLKRSSSGSTRTNCTTTARSRRSSLTERNQRHR